MPEQTGARVETYTVRQELTVEATSHAEALRIAHEIWDRDVHNELAAHHSAAIIEVHHD